MCLSWTSPHMHVLSLLVCCESGNDIWLLLPLQATAQRVELQPNTIFGVDVAVIPDCGR